MAAGWVCFEFALDLDLSAASGPAPPVLDGWSAGIEARLTQRVLRALRRLLRQRSQLLASAGNRPWGEGRPALRLSTNKMALVGTTPATRRRRPALGLGLPAVAPLAGAAQRRPGGDWELGYQAVAPWRGRRRRALARTPMAEQLRQQLQRGTAPRPVAWWGTHRDESGLLPGAGKSARRYGLGPGQQRKPRGWPQAGRNGAGTASSGEKAPCLLLGMGRAAELDAQRQQLLLGGRGKGIQWPDQATHVEGLQCQLVAAVRSASRIHENRVNQGCD